LSKLLALGMELEEVIAAATVAPARALGATGAGLGTLRAGSPGDVAVYRLVEGHFEFRDVFGGTLPAERRLEPVLTVRAGQVMRRC